MSCAKKDAIELKAAWKAFLEAHGVPISMEFVRLAHAVGEFTGALIALPTDHMPKVFIDMDGVIVDFDTYRKGLGLTGDQTKIIPGAYRSMKPFPGAIAAVKSLIGMGFDVYIATKPPTGVAHAYAEKAEWILEHLPELKRKIIITHDKGLLGNLGDFLIDDRPHKAHCEEFKGTLIRFVDGMTWDQAIMEIRGEYEARKFPGHDRTTSTDC